MDRLEEYAEKNSVPIMQKEGIDFLVKYINENNIKSILEIGTAIGYSSIKMAKVDPSIKITTIERNETLYEEALKNVEKFNLSNQITLIKGDALFVDIDEKFDMIFIDAAKAQYIKFFTKYEKNLSDNGVIISDNLKFHGLIDNIDDVKSKNLKALLRKLKNYIDFLENNQQYETIFLPIGDGISLSKKRF